MKARQLIIKNLERHYSLLNMRYRESENRREVQKYRIESTKVLKTLKQFRDLGDN